MNPKCKPDLLFVCVLGVKADANSDCAHHVVILYDSV